MNRRHLIAAAIALWLGGCGYLIPDPFPQTRHVRMTVEVDTPDGLRAGSSVIAIKTQKSFNPNASTFFWAVSGRGEAVAVDLPGGKTLFALLDINTYDTVTAGIGGGDKTRSAKDWLDQADRDRKLYTYPARAKLRPSFVDYPRLVTFTDIRDPETVTRVDPDDLAASFGTGVTLRRITLQVTDYPMTTGIEKRLGWLGKYPEPRLDPNFKGSFEPKDIGPAQALTHGDFRKGKNG